MLSGFAAMRDRHRGKTFIILGCSSEALQATKAKSPKSNLSALASATAEPITIGVNTTPFMPGPATDYWCASHPGMCLLTRRLIEKSETVGVFCEKPRFLHKYDALFTWLHRVPCVRERRFKKRRDIMIRGIRAYSTIILEAGQLAIYLGAKRIVFAGVSMRTHKHWYHEPGQKPALGGIRQAVARVQKLSFPDEETEKRNLRGILGPDAASAPFRTHTGFGYLKAEIAQFMERANYHGVSLASASADSLLIDCGMKVEEGWRK